MHEISPVEGGPPSHPYIAVVTIDPADFRQLESLVEDAPEARILRRIADEPDLWTIHIACASMRVRERVEEAWS